ncbi:MAG: CPXCG motif-containing cysteine-rich protein [Verrucomicrobia bacterium]|nr:CPXCG motif-containing cysteine-rich protein [Verrucomicrobiota bacterium]
MSDHLTCECPYCGCESSVPVDVWDGDWETVSDCENCCRPFRIIATLHAGEVEDFQVEC